MTSISVDLPTSAWLAVGGSTATVGIAIHDPEVAVIVFLITALGTVFTRIYEVEFQ